MELDRIEEKLLQAIELMACIDGSLQERLGTAFVEHLLHLEFDPLYGELGERLQLLFDRMSVDGLSWPEAAESMSYEEANAVAIEVCELYSFARRRHG